MTRGRGAAAEQRARNMMEAKEMNKPPMREFDHLPVIDGKVGNGVKFERIRRITGYLVGTVDRFNNAKRAEVRDRVVHLNISPEAPHEAPSRHDGDDGTLRRGVAGQEPVLP